jgi:hypothetical protein
LIPCSDEGDDLEGGTIGPRRHVKSAEGFRGSRTGLLTAALFACSLFVLSAAMSASAAGPAVPIAPGDVNATVKSGAQCAPCHARIAEARKPGIIFSHGAHLLISCDACHWAPPHQGGTTLGPTMDSCFNCHGVPHGDKPLARGDCAACHPKTFNFRPITHLKDWKAKPHADRAKQGENRCLMCHDPKAFCDDCHVKQGLSVKPTQTTYRTLLPNKPARPKVLIYPQGQTSMGQCVKCHPDLDAFLPGRVIFAHGQHLDKAFRCESCHKTFGHGPGATYRPDMPTCYACHGLVHAARAMVATVECSACHPKDFKLVPADHTPAFIAKDHKEGAAKQPEMCGMCHEPSFCTACHQGRPKKPGGPARPKIIPADHTKRDFLFQHGKTYLKQGGACASCHEGTTCAKCHKTPVPHPPDWTASHALAIGLDAADCNVCHSDRSKCQGCHHQTLRGTELLLENCVRCHPVMRTKPATAIQSKGLAEHAVHFDVSKKKGSRFGKPYRCEDCHVGFGTTSIEHGSALTGGHDLRLCYDCHGALDYRNVIIAPYPGNELCYRCHTNLNL